MKKELPKLYRGTLKNGIGNNLRASHGIKEEKKSPRVIINELFKENEIYRQEVQIVTNMSKFITKIIGRTQEHIITINNEVIKINDIKEISLLK